MCACVCVCVCVKLLSAACLYYVLFVLCSILCVLLAPLLVVVYGVVHTCLIMLTVASSMFPDISYCADRPSLHRQRT